MKVSWVYCQNFDLILMNATKIRSLITFYNEKTDLSLLLYESDLRQDSVETSITVLPLSFSGLFMGFSIACCFFFARNYSLYFSVDLSL